MNGLKALKRIRQETAPNTYNPDFDKNECCDVIEHELKDKEKFDNFMKRYNLNSIEELDDFFNQCLNKEIEKCSKCKELKALEIIKKRLPPLMRSALLDYCNKEEYDSLKEAGL